MARRRKNAEVIEMERTAEVMDIPVARERKSVALDALRKHSIKVALPSGKKVILTGYVTRRAANIDAKALAFQLRAQAAEEAGVEPSEIPVVASRGKRKDQIQRATVPRKERKVAREVGYSFADESGEGGSFMVKNPFRLRHNTHLPVGTTVDYKGKTAKVTAQHDRDVYTVRFASTGKSMRVPGFLLVRR